MVAVEVSVGVGDAVGVWVMVGVGGVARAVHTVPPANPTTIKNTAATNNTKGLTCITHILDEKSNRRKMGKNG
jgi:hypothetical protein